MPHVAPPNVLGYPLAPPELSLVPPLVISYRLNYLDRHYQYTPALPAYQFPDLPKGVADPFIAIE